MSMTKQPDYYKYLEMAKRAELAAQLTSSGFRVVMDEKMGPFEYDLIAKRGNEKIAFEVT